jgi:D-alanyl-D-alanine carboxypeptidase (penicillin-binding protein 5/6)
MLVPVLAVAPAAAMTATRPLATPSPSTLAPPPPPAAAWVLVDADTGNVLDSGNDRTALPPASLTKVITALAALAVLPPGPLTLAVSARAAAMPATKISMQQGQVWTLDDTLHALLLSSANDAAVALAERAGGTVEGFQPVFAATAARIGMTDHPVLNDPAGLDGPQGVEGGNLVSARDLAIATRALLDQPALAAIVATPVYRFTGPDGFHHRLTNHNYGFLTRYPGAIGVKTGYTARAGPCLIAAARRGARTFIAVVMHSANPDRAAADLLDKGFATPAAAEPTSDRLPPRRAAAAATVPPATPARSPVPPATTAPGAGAAPARLSAPGAPRAETDAGRVPGRASSWWRPALAIVLLLVVAVAAVVRLRALHRYRRRAAAADGAAEPDPT